MTVINADARKKSIEKATQALNNLTLYSEHKHHAKVCCICDSFIVYNDEHVAKYELFDHKNVISVLSKKSFNLFDYGLPESVQKQYIITIHRATLSVAKKDYKN